MARFTTLLGLALLTTGCMRMHSLAADGQGGAYVVAQKRFLGIGGKQTLLHCPVQGVITAQCGVVMQSPDVRDLGPVQYQPAGTSPGGVDDVWGSIGDLLGDLSDLDDDVLDEYPWYGGDIALPGNDGAPVVCPDGAVRDVTSIPEGTTVTLIAIHRDDAYSGSDYERSLPMAGTVQGDLHANDGCWLGGGFVSDDGTDFYFYKAAFRLD